MQIAFIGLGVMGGPMAINLQTRGEHQLSIFDLDIRRLQLLEKQGARVCDSVSEAIQSADIVMTSLPGPQQIALVAFDDDGIFRHIKKGAVWIDLSTNNLETCHLIKKAAEQAAVDFLDAPVSGGDEGARAGNLTVLVGGQKEVFRRYKSVLDVIGENISLLGPNGAGYSAKIAQVVLCYLHSLALSEALMLGIKGGVDPAQMLSIVQNSTGKSYVADRYGPSILAGDYDPSFTVGLALKDMNLALEMADSLGLDLPMCNLTTATYTKAVEKYGFDANHLKAVRVLEEYNSTFLQN